MENRSFLNQSQSIKANLLNRQWFNMLAFSGNITKPSQENLHLILPWLRVDMVCGSMIKSVIKQTAASKTVESSCCFSLNLFHNTKQGLALIPQLTVSQHSFIQQPYTNSNVATLIVHFNCLSDLMLRSKVISAFTFCRFS